MKNQLLIIFKLFVKISIRRKYISITPLFLFCAHVYCGKTIDPKLKVNAHKWIQAQPVQFLENKGQMSDVNGKAVPFVLFTTSVPGINMYVTEKGLTYLFLKMEDDVYENFRNEKEENRKTEWTRIDMALKGASIKKENIIKEGVSSAFSQYFYGHCPDGITDVHTYEKITIKEIYSGIDWVLYNSGTKGFKYDFIIHPGANPKQIALVYSSLKPLKLNNHGTIKIKNKLGTLTENAPYSYFKETKKEVVSKFHIIDQQLINNNYYQTTVVFHFESLFTNHNSTLIIDPQLFWATLYGGNAPFSFPPANYEGSMSLTTDNAGNLFIVGYTASSVVPIPLLDAGTFFQGTSGGGAIGTDDAFILKFTNTGVLLWATYYGGNGLDAAQSIATDFAGNIFITGYTRSGNFPVCNTCTGYFSGTIAGTQDAFFLKFDNAGNRLWATFYGINTGFNNEKGYSVATDATGNVFMSGRFGNANSVEKFTNAGAFIWTHNTSSLDPLAIATDVAGNVFITGSIYSFFGAWTFTDLCSSCSGYFQAAPGGGQSDAAIIKLNGAGTVLWATYYGGSGNDEGRSIAIDNNGNVFVLGLTKSGNFPTQNPGTGAYFDGSLAGTSDAFILKFDNVGNRQWGSYYGGSGLEEHPSGTSVITYDNLATDFCGNIYASFETTSTDINTKSSCDGGFYDNTYNGSTSDVFITNFSNSGILLWATYLGGNGQDFRASLAVDNNGSLFISGETVAGTNTFPFTNPAGGSYYDNNQNQQGEDLYIAKFEKLPLASSTSSVNAGCNCAGSASVTVTAGCPPFNYVWSNGNQTLNTTNTDNSIVALCAGTYTVTVTSNCNQSKTSTFAITSSGCGITANVNSTTICAGSTPCPTLTAMGISGTTPYTYLWSTTENSSSINPCPLVTTSYTVTITDLTGTTATTVSTVTVNSAVTASITSTNSTCSGAPTGSITATGSGGTSPFTFNWSNFVSGSVVSGLTAGTYTVTVTDSKGCTATTSATLVTPPPLVGQFTKGTATCTNCGCKEWILINATGGTMPYSYLWPDAYDKRYKNKICPGNYNVKVTDMNGCSVDVTVNAP